jgi:site-specific recombinase XerD
MKNETTKMNKPDQDGQLILFAGSEAAEDLIYEFLRNLSPSTERSYQRDLKAFFDFTTTQFALPRAVENRLLFGEIRRVHIVKYKKYLEAFVTNRNKGYAPNTINRMLSTVSSFFQFLVQREVIDKNPADLCTRPNRIVLEETQAFSDREMKGFFDLVIAEAPPMHKAAILLLFTTGMRQAELRNLKLSNFKSQEGILFLNYMGKGQKINQVPIHPTTAFYIDEYVKGMGQQGRKIEQVDFLFQQTKNTPKGKVLKPLSHTAMGYIIRKWAQQINKEKRITPHSARATFISSLIENGEDIYYISQLVNHADVRTTQRYNKRKRTHRKNPIFNLNFF